MARHVKDKVPGHGNAMELRQKIGNYGLKDPSRPSNGGMARVYEATHPELPMTVAIKEPLPECRTPEYISIFKTEAERTAKLKHDNIVEVKDSGLDEDPPFVVLEWLPDSVGQLLEKQIRISWQRAVNYGIQVCRALDYAHNEKPPLIHQDIKPDNLLRTPLEAIKVADFGLSYAIKSVGSVPPVYDTKGGGTRAYQPPEQWYDAPVDARTDIYAVGITLYECITGYPPFQHENDFALLKLHEQAPLPELPDNVSIPDSLLEIISKATAKDPDDRYPNAFKMKQALEALERTSQREAFIQEERDRTELELIEEEELRIAQRKQDLLERIESRAATQQATPELMAQELPVDQARTDSAERLLNEWGQFYNLGNYEEGIEFFTHLLEQDDTYAKNPSFLTIVLLFRSQCFQSLGMLEDAANDLSELINNTNGGKPGPGTYHNRGCCYLDLGWPEMAVDDFTKAIELGMDNEDVYISRGLCYQALDMPIEAAADFTLVISHIPDDPIGYIYRASAKLDLGDFEDSIKDLTISMDLDNNMDGSSYLLRGQAYYEAGEYQLAINDLDVAPPTVTNFYYCGRAHYELERYEDAIIYFTEGLSLDENNSEIISFRGKTYAALGEFQNAVDDFSYRLELNPGSGSSHAERAIAYMFLSEYRKAVDDYTTAIDIFRSGQDYKWLASCYVERGNCWRNLNVPQSAISDYDSALRIYSSLDQPSSLFNSYNAYSDDSSQIYRYRGFAHYELDDYKNAVDDFDKVLEYDNEDGFITAYRGKAYLNLGELGLALSDFSAAILLEPMDSYNYFYLGQVFLKQNEYPSAVKNFTRAIELQEIDIDPEFYFARGLALNALERYEEAINDFDSVEERGGFPDFFRYRGEAYLALNQHEPALKDFEYAVGEINDIDSLRLTGAVHALMGDLENAITYLEEARNRQNETSVDRPT